MFTCTHRLQLQLDVPLSAKNGQSEEKINQNVVKKRHSTIKEKRNCPKSYPNKKTKNVIIFLSFSF